MLGEGRYFDGESGQRLTVALDLDTAAGHLRLSHPDFPGGAYIWPLMGLRSLADLATENRMVLSLAKDHAVDSALIETARLTLRDPAMIEAVQNHAPNLKKRDLPQGSGRKIVTRIGLAVGALALMIFVILPGLANTLANYIPIEREVAYGRSVVEQMERFLGGTKAKGLTCSNPEGVAALDAMTTRLTDAAEVNYDLNIAVFNHKMVNAFAAPGGQIVLMRGLIEKAESPDEVAAVLAHEIGHVEARDTTRAALRTAGSAGLLSMVLGDFAGGSAVLVVAEYTLNASYTREAEGKADQFALNMMQASGTDAGALGTFFDRLAGLEAGGPGLPVYLSSHPDTKERANAAREFAEGQTGTKPILDDTQWQALKDICKE